VDEQVEFRFVGHQLLYKLLAGKDPATRGSSISAPLPRLPAEAITFTFRQRAGRSKAQPAQLEPADVLGFPAVAFTVNDEKGREASYQFEILWQLKPYTLDTLTTDVEELSGSYPDQLTAMVRRRGYGSALSPEDEQKLRTAGASAELIASIRGSIRPANNPPK